MKINVKILFYLLIVMVACGSMSNRSAAQPNKPAESIRVMSFNLWQGGDAGKQPLSQTLAVIQAARADVIGIQEAEGIAPQGTPRPDNAAKLAKELGWNYAAQNGRKGIISRFPILAITAGKHGVVVELPSGQRVCIFNVHLSHSPYQPYQLLNIPYDDGAFLKTAEEAMEAAIASRGKEIDQVIKEIKAVQSQGDWPIFLTGDFNEPCCLDWTSDVANAKLCPIEVCWPTTKKVVDAGFVDAYREVYPDPTTHRGLTWTPLTKLDDPADRHDRIDLIFLKSHIAKVKTVEIVGEATEFADLVVTPYPSDHRAVVAEVELRFPHKSK